MTKLEFRPWVPQHAETYVQSLASRFAAQEADALERELLALVDENRTIHERDCVNLNPATNVMNPKAEALLRAGHRRAALARLSRRQVRDGAGGHREDRGHGGRACGARCSARASPRSASARARSPISMCSWRRPSRATPSSRRRRASAGMSPITARAPRAVRHRHASGADRSGDLHRGCGRAARRCAAAQAQAHHHRRQPQPVPASDPRDPRHRRRGRRARAVRCRAYVGHDRRPRLAAAAGGGRPCDDDEHLQEPRRAAVGPDRHQ